MKLLRTLGLVLTGITFLLGTTINIPDDNATIKLKNKCERIFLWSIY